MATPSYRYGPYLTQPYSFGKQIMYVGLGLLVVAIGVVAYLNSLNQDYIKHAANIRKGYMDKGFTNLAQISQEKKFEDAPGFITETYNNI
tara:strand:+ start:1068 stop:1337 length:270 start_codon:yes stop_codon:yes gene_type:complete